MITISQCYLIMTKNPGFISAPKSNGFLSGPYPNSFTTFRQHFFQNFLSNPTRNQTNGENMTSVSDIKCIISSNEEAQSWTEHRSTHGSWNGSEKMPHHDACDCKPMNRFRSICLFTEVLSACCLKSYIL